MNAPSSINLSFHNFPTPSNISRISHPILFYFKSLCTGLVAVSFLLNTGEGSSYSAILYIDFLHVIYMFASYSTRLGNGQHVRRRWTIDAQVDQFRWLYKPEKLRTGASFSMSLFFCFTFLQKIREFDTLW